MATEQEKRAATEQIFYVLEQLGPVRLSEGMASISHPVKTDVSDAWFAGGDVVLSGPQADTVRGQSALPSQKIQNQSENINAPMAS